MILFLVIVLVAVVGIMESRMDILIASNLMFIGYGAIMAADG